MKWAMAANTINDYINCAIMPFPELPKVKEEGIIDESQEKVIDEYVDQRLSFIKASKL